ncbi:iron-siderophore ABC transporter substrate-binding protein [Amycolatopsis ultiminotia]|uniref:Iron-siderophore ABC transporter substrate-binding protein n=1 Tax=Amycolatopsis ultiminotia TaxID=543629 RepID=A0ABP6YN50_9PSEU
MNRPTAAWRMLTAVAAAFVLLGTLTACGGSSTEATSTAPSTKSFHDANGTTVQIPVKPEKVVTLSETALDDALALGVRPVGTTAGRGQDGPPSYLTAQAAGIPIVASTKEPNLEQILAQDPDLIIVDDTTGARNQFAELQKIAPTVWAANPAIGWQAYFTKIADVLGRQDEATKVLGSIRHKTEETKAKAAGKLPATASVVRWADSGPAISGGNSLASLLLSQVGLTRPPSQQNVDSKNRAGQTVSLEQLDLIDADYLFVGVLGDVRAGQAALDRARKLPNFAQLNAVRGNRTKVVDGTAWTSSSGPLGVNVILDDIAATLG